MTPPALQSIRTRSGKPNPQFDAVFHAQYVERLNVAGAIDDAFVQAEAEREVLEIQRCRHHHGVGAAIVCQGDRRLFRDRTRPLTLAILLPSLAANDARGFDHGRISTWLAQSYRPPRGEPTRRLDIANQTGSFQ